MQTFHPKYNPELNMVSVQGSCLRPFNEYKYRTVTDTIVIHCAATLANSKATAEDVREWHVDEGWVDIGYHYVIERDGTVSQGRPMMAEGSGVKGHNLHTIHVCMMGGANAAGRGENNFTPAQWKSLELVVFELKTHHFRDAKVCGHRDFKGVLKDCPSFDVGFWFTQVLAPKLKVYTDFKGRTAGGVAVEQAVKAALKN